MSNSSEGGKSCLYQGHDDNIIVHYLKEEDRGECLSCTEDALNKNCSKSAFVNNQEKFNLIDNMAKDYFVLKER